jgi:hypothetical protein
VDAKAAQSDFKKNLAFSQFIVDAQAVQIVYRKYI